MRKSHFVVSRELGVPEPVPDGCGPDHHHLHPLYQQGGQGQGLSI